jgi:hypothetical protein
LKIKSKKESTARGVYFGQQPISPAISAVVTRGGNVKRGREKTEKRNKQKKERKGKIEVIRVT